MILAVPSGRVLDSEYAGQFRNAVLTQLDFGNTTYILHYYLVCKCILAANGCFEPSYT
jgi:hypothetical protein